jgi:polyphosphate glucokinase
MTQQAAETGTVAFDPASPGTPSPRPWTLVFDVGGTGLKAALLDASGRMIGDRARVRTTYPCPPERLVAELAALGEQLGRADRVSVGFPGMVRKGVVLSAPKFDTVAGPGSAVSPELGALWGDFALGEVLGARLGVPVRVANDADVQGAAVVAGTGFELVITLGTGVGTAAFYDGTLLPHLEFAHHQFRKDQTYEEQLGELARKDVGDERWVRRVRKAISALRALTFFSHCYVGGGSARRLPADLAPDVTIVANTAGLLGGIALWDGRQPVA